MKFELWVTEAGQLEIVPGEHFGDEDVPTLVAAANAVQDVLRQDRAAA